MTRPRKIALGCAVLLALPILIPVLIILLAAPFNGRTPAPTDYPQSALLKNPPPAWTAPATLKVATFNIADAYGFTSNRPERMNGIAAKLIELDPDLVGFQEAFVERDRKLLIEALQPSRLKYHVRFPSGTTGNGLLILSAYPIREHWFYRFEVSNPWYRIWEGDWWAGKGVGLARVELPNGFLDFYDTHAQAGRSHPTHYLEVRTQQLTGLAQFINATRVAPALLAGDFNTRLDRADMRAAIDTAKLERMMSMDSRIDHIFAVEDPNYRYEVLDTVEIKGSVQGSRAHIFLSRAPSPAELKGILFGPGEASDLSDHSGYLSTVRISPK